MWLSLQQQLPGHRESSGELYTLDPFKYTIDAIKAGTANVDVSKKS